jgi:uncharacterized membrane protein
MGSGHHIERREGCVMTSTREGAEDHSEDTFRVDDEPLESPALSKKLPGAWVIKPAWLVVALAIAQVTVALDVNLPVVRPLIALFTLLGVPTLLLYRKAGFPGDSAARGLYAFGSSLLGVMAVGLLLNATLPLVGVDHPLQPMVLAITWFLADVALLMWRAEPLELPRLSVVLRRVLDARIEPTQALGVVSVVLAVVGAVRLNNGAGGAVAVLAQAIAGAALVTLMVRRDATLGRDVRTLALVATSLLLATSLRGWDITGHDIQAEYFAFKITNSNQLWSMDVLQNAYNACLSVNILPTVLAQTTSLSGTSVFKVLLQLVFALVPVLTFLLSRRFLSRRLALGAATFTMAFPTFFTDMPYLVRQEIAFFFLALLLLVATEPDRPAGRIRWLAGFFGVGVVLSHYSTTYLMIMGLVVGLVVLLVWKLSSRRFGRGPEANHGPLVLLSPVLVVFLTLASLLWAGPATHTGGHAGDVARETVAAIFGKGADTPGSSDVSYRLFFRDKVSPRERLDLFVGQTIEARKQARPGELVIKHPGRPELRPEIVPTSTVPLTRAGQAVESIGVNPSKLSSAARLACAGLLQLFLLFGVIRLLSRTRRRAGRTSGPEVPLELICVVLGSMAVLGLVVLVPSLSVEYGVLRAFQQTLLIVAPVMAAGMWLLLRPFAKHAAVMAVAVPVGLLLILCSVVPALLGGNPARLALENSGVYYDRYLASDADVSAMAWLAAAGDSRGSQPEVIASSSNVIRIMSTAKRPLQVADLLYPTLLTNGSYVFVDSHLGQKRQATVFYSGDLITYVYPMQDLNQHLNLVYSSGLNRVYR